MFSNDCLLQKHDMAETKHLVFAICKFLEEQQFSGNLSADGIESLEGNACWLSVRR